MDMASTSLSRLRAMQSIVILFAFLLCNGGLFFCHMVYASEGEHSHSSASDDSQGSHGSGCSESLVSSMASPVEDQCSLFSSIGLGVAHQLWSSSLFHDFSLDTSIPVLTHPPLFILLSTLRN